MNWALKAYLVCVILCVLYSPAGDASERTAVVVTKFTPIAYTASKYADQGTALVRAALADANNIDVLDRDDLSDIVEERTLGETMSPTGEQTAQSQGVRGAQYLLGGSILIDGFRVHFFGKLVSVDTGSMSAFTVSEGDNGDMSSLSRQIGKKVRKIILERASEPRPVVKSHLSRSAELASQLEGREKPALSVTIDEMHFARRIIDPAAQTEFQMFAGEAGFPLIDTDPEFKQFIDVRVTGEGFTEVSYRRGSAFGITARLEIKAVSLRTGRVLAVDRQTSVVLSSSEMIGSKNALAKASAAIAERMLPRLAPEQP